MRHNYELFNTPVSALVTFNTQEAAERCGKFFYKKDSFTGKANPDHRFLTIDTVELDVTEAPEPSDIIYENFEIEPHQV